MEKSIVQEPVSVSKIFEWYPALVVRCDVLNIVGGEWWAEYLRSQSLNLLELAPVHWQ